MKTKTLKITFPTATVVSLLALGLLSACKPKDTAPEPKADAGAPAASAPAAPSAPTAAEPAPTAPPATATPASTAGTGLVHYDAQPGGGKVKIEGTSSIHDWNMESPVIGGFMEADAGFPESALKGGAAAKPKVEVFIPVRSLKSYNKKMDEVYQTHMEEAKFKKMEYKLIELKPKSGTATGGKCEFDAVGTLTIHGVSKEITMPVTIEKDAQKAGQLKMTGSTSLKMSDFDVKPPNPNIPGIGQITTGDEIKLTFEWSPKQK